MTTYDMLETIFAIHNDIEKKCRNFPNINPLYKKASKQLCNAYRNLKKLREL